MIRRRGFYLAEAVILVSAFAIFGFAVWGAYIDSNSPVIELKVTDWQCTKHEQTTHLQPMMVGKVTILQPMVSTACVEYRNVKGAE